MRGYGRIRDMAIFSAWQNREVVASVLSEKGKLIDFTFKRIMVDYADALMDRGGEKEAYEEVGCNRYDVANWKDEYPEYIKYLEMRASAKAFANSINLDFVYGILGKAAMGQIELTAPQTGALRLIMQGKGFIAANGAQKRPSGVRATGFDIEEPDEKQ